MQIYSYDHTGPVMEQEQSLAQTIPEKERVVLLEAMDQGYFEVPREISLSELATELGMTKAEASQRLTRGMVLVMREECDTALFESNTHREA